MRHVFVIGDSISMQYGPELRKLMDGKYGYDRKRAPDQAADDLDRPTGANGGDSAMVLDYLEAERGRGVRYDILLLNCGLHDIKIGREGGGQQVPLPLYQQYLHRIARIALEMAKQVVWVRTTDAVDDVHNAPGKVSFLRFHADVVQYNEAADAIFGSYGIPLLDLYSFSRAFGPGAYYDHVHFKEEVRQLQAAYMVGFLDSRFGQGHDPLPQ